MFEIEFSSTTFVIMMVKGKNNFNLIQIFFTFFSEKQFFLLIDMIFYT